MDPVAEAVAQVKKIGADRIELYTESYARAFERGDPAHTLGAYVDAAASAREAGLGINAGHDLNQANLEALLDAIPDIAEVSIGHALICEALYDGFANTVRAYAAICSRASR
jgi:pyridoxine 5-phosphate synthase